MARESCNLDKDEAEIFKPSSPSPPSPSSSSQPPPPSSLHLKSCEESAVLRPERPKSPAPGIRNFVASSSTPKPDEGASETGEESRIPVRFSNRCSACQRKVGLTGFRCRCGDLFCGRHRYSDVHDCSFDYKAAGREEIAKANPVIKAAKIVKI